MEARGQSHMRQGKARPYWELRGGSIQGHFKIESPNKEDIGELYMLQHIDKYVLKRLLCNRL